MRRRLGENRVQGHDERLRQLFRKGQHVVAVTPAEDPVLVLQQDDVDIEAAQHSGSAHVIPADGLPDRREQGSPLRARGLVDDGDDVGALDAVHAEQCSSQVGRERADPAGTGREGGDDCRTHG